MDHSSRELTPGTQELLLTLDIACRGTTDVRFTWDELRDRDDSEESPLGIIFSSRGDGHGDDDEDPEPNCEVPVMMV